MLTITPPIALADAGPSGPANAGPPPEATEPGRFMDALAGVLAGGKLPVTPAGQLVAGKTGASVPGAPVGPRPGPPADPALASATVPGTSSGDPEPVDPRRTSPDNAERSNARSGQPRVRSSQEGEQALPLPTQVGTALPSSALPVRSPPPSSTDAKPAHPVQGHDVGPAVVGNARGDAHRTAHALSDAAASPPEKTASGAVTSNSTDATAGQASSPATAFTGPPSTEAVGAMTATAAGTHAAPAGKPSQPSAAAAGETGTQPVPVRQTTAQVAPVMVSLASAGSGTHRLVLRLEPAELGRVEVHMVRAADTGARVEITVDRPATLALLRQDEPALHRALDNAGVPVEGRSLTMQLGSPGQHLSGQGSGQGGGHASGQGTWSSRRPGATEPGGGAESAPAGLSAAPLPAPRALSAGLDITA